MIAGLSAEAVLNAAILVTILVMSVVLHELSHGLVADRLGDPTARFAGRLTLNPLKHLDPLGSIFLPLLLIFSGSSFVFGWAKPVPYNPRNLRNRRWGPALVGVAGPVANIALALLFGLGIRSGALQGLLPHAVVLINLVLAVFNLIPIPPLDGSKLIYAVLPASYLRIYAQLETVGILVAVGFVYYLGGYILSPPVRFLFRLITGRG